MSEKKSKLSRRAFVKRTAALAALPAIVPASVFGRNGAVPPSERIIVGAIGIRGRGMSDLGWMLPERDIQFVAICDAQKRHAEKVKERVDKHYGNNNCATYPEINEFLATRTDIDAVLITTGDRWHAMASILAMRAGKDVYSEKPSAMTMAEGRAVEDTARRYRRIYQTGTQRLSEGNFTFANELLRLGYLGDVHTVRAHIAPWDAAEMSHEWRAAEPQPPKEEVDWDAWLGPCPWRPYNAAYTRGGWRNFYDFHTSCIGEWGAHTFAQCQVAMGAGDTSAIEYGYVNNDSGDRMVTKFANGINMVLERDMDKKIWHGSCGARYEGTKGWVATADGYAEPEMSNPLWMRDFKKLVANYMARTQRPMSHMRNWLDCVKSRRQTVSNAVMMHHTMSTVHAANICMWLKRDLRFDPSKEEFINDAEANRFCTRAMREPWIY
jgi:GFO/IDH/MocA oxidoreductase family protein